MRLLINNKVLLPTITVNNPSTAFPPENLINNNLIESTFFEDFIDIDLVTAQLINAVALVGTDASYVLQANSVQVWTSPPFEQTITDDVTFISETFRFWRITFSGGTGTSNINYFYLGEFLQLPGMVDFPTPQEISNDITNTTQSGQKFTTPGITFKTQEFSFPDTSQTDYDAFKSWWKSDNRSDNIFLVQFENDMILFEPYFAKILDFTVDERNYLAYSWGILAEEAK